MSDDQYRTDLSYLRRDFRLEQEAQRRRTRLQLWTWALAIGTVVGLLYLGSRGLL